MSSEAGSLQNEVEERAAADLGDLHRDSARGMRDALRLGSSLSVMWAIALVTELYMRRRLGVALAGQVDFGLGAATVALILISLGVDTYIHNEIPRRPDHAADFVGGILVTRALFALVLLGVASGALLASGKPRAVVALVLVFGVGQFFFHATNTHAAVLHSVRKVGRLSVVNIVGQLLWSVIIIVGLAVGLGPMVVACALVASELLKTVLLGREARRHVQVPWRWDPRLAFGVALASLPFLATQVNIAMSTYLDPIFLSYLSDDREVGWYGAASRIAGVALVLSPIVQWVVLPMAARAVARSEADLIIVIRRSLQLVLSAAIPISVLLAVAAREEVLVAVGSSYAPSVASLRILSLMFVLTYAAILAATFLIRVGRSWFVAGVTGGGILLNSLLNVILIPLGLHRWGAGGGARGCALAFIATEAVTTAVLLAALGRRAVDRSLLRAVGLSVVAAGAIVLLDHLLRHLGWARLIVDVAAYAGLLLVLQVFDLRQLRRLVLDRSLP